MKLFNDFQNKLFSSTDNSIIHNRWILYLLLILSLANLFYFAQQSDYDSVILFILISGIIMNYNKNMLIVLLCSLFITNLFRVGYHKFEKL